jgi:hypothetical protein
VEYGEYEAFIAINTFRLLEGVFPPRILGYGVE